MGHDLTSVKANAQLKEVVKILSKNALSGVPVVNEKNEVIGYISEKDIIVSVFPESLKFENPEIISLEKLAPHIKKLSRRGASIVGDYMSETLYSVTEDAPQSDVIELMLAKNLKRLPVIRDKHLVGVIERATVSKFGQKGYNLA